MKKSKKWLIPCIVLIIVFALYLLFGNVIKIKGSWYKRVDVSKDIVENMEYYMGSFTGGEDAMIDLDKYINEEDYYVAYKVTFGWDGSYKEEFDEKSYEVCKDKAYEDLKTAVSEVLVKSLEAANVDTDKSAEELVNEAVGMDIDTYLRDYGPALLPNPEEFVSEGASEMTYDCSMKRITITSVIDEKEEKSGFNYYISNGLLILENGNVTELYHKKL